MSDWTSKFEPFDRVTIDRDASLVGTVTAFNFRPNPRDDERGDGRSCVHLVEVSYVHNGDLKSGWVEETRLTKV